MPFSALTHLVRVVPVRPFVVRDDAPASLAQVAQALSETGRLVVWGGGSDKTIYGARELNWRFRAWHDATHLAVGGEFTPEGELATCLAQQDTARRLLREAGRAEEQLWAEVMGQLEYQAVHGIFPEDQVTFHEQYGR